ncbi:MAG: SpoIIE family protein phosphatase [Clostridia bacterium]|nr:SpoIIE family protein phosphatase [Clostridia bacterium]
MRKFKLSYQSVLKTVLSATLCLVLNGVHEKSFLSASFFISILYIGFNPFTSALAFILPFFFKPTIYRIFSALLGALAVCPVFTVMRRKKREIGGKIIPLSLLAVLPFIILGGKENLTFNAVQGALSIVLSLIFVSSSRVIFLKNFKYKCAVNELVCLALFSVILGLGIINLLGFNVYRSIAIFTLLCCSFIFSKGVTLVTAVTLAFSPSIISFNFDYFASLSLIALSACLFSDKSKFLTAISSIFADLLFLAVFKIYGSFYYLDVLYSVAPACLFLFLPSKLYSLLKKQTDSLGELYLTRHAVNRTRLAISQKLYELAGVFGQMKRGFEELKRERSSGDELFLRMADEVIMNVCESCPSFEICKNKRLPDTDELKNIISVGVAKGRISLIDLTKKFVSECGYVNSVIFEVNSLIAKYAEKVKEAEEIAGGKELITMQSAGVQGVLKNLALDFSKSLSLSDKLEKTVSDALHKKGVIYKEIMVLENDCGIEVTLTFDTELINLQKTEKIVSEALGLKMSVALRTSLSLTTCAVTLRPAPVLDAAFGLASTKKFGSEKSGDTHSLVKIDEGKFMVCLSDGMGSGDEACRTSGTAISLIESFYKAGIDGNAVLGMVNKILAIGTDESFSAMDILSVNLFNLSCDFIKIGSPSSFIITDQSIRIVDGSSLPLGILDDLKPTSLSLPLAEGTTVLMVTDGISDAFGSSTDIINYLKTLKSLNPQKLADDVLNYALKQENGRARDDMTAVCVRIFKKVS